MRRSVDVQDPWPDRVSRITEGAVSLIGLPFDDNSSFLRGAAEGPAAACEALYSAASNLCAESGRDLGVDEGWSDLGAAPLGAGADGYEAIETTAGQVLERGGRLLALGGDHSVTYPLVRAHAAVHDPVNILHLDAHPDLYDELDGNRVSHACPFARILEDGLAQRLVQLGIRTWTTHQREQAARLEVEVIDHPLALAVSPPFDGSVYLSIDLDVLDPAFAPGVSHHEPGGLSTRDVIEVIHALDVPILGADIVELNPGRDPSGVTAAAAAKLVKEVVDAMLTTAP